MGIAAVCSILLCITTGLQCLGSRGLIDAGHLTQRCSYTGGLHFERLMVQLDNGELDNGTDTLEAVVRVDAQSCPHTQAASV